MSMMSDIQGTPERVWSLVRLLHAYDGRLAREEVLRWFDPLGADPKHTAVLNTIGAARSLGLVENDAPDQPLELRLTELPVDLDGFSDWVHDRLVQLPDDHSDAIVLRAFSWFTASSGKRQGLSGLSTRTEDLVQSIRSDLGAGTEGSTFNQTRYPRWRDWIKLLGLGWDLPSKSALVFHPHVTERMERLVRSLFGTRWPEGEEIEAEAFLRELAAAMPYIDGGRLFVQTAQQIGWSPPVRQLSPVTSNALRDLHDDKRIELVMRGDAREAIQLAPDPAHRLRAFHAVRVNLAEVEDG